MYYPLFLDLRCSRCLIVGAGRVGRRKLADVLACNPKEVLVLDPGLSAEAVSDITSDSRVRFAARSFLDEDVSGCRLVFAATSSSAVNRAVAEACRAYGVLCNCVDAPDRSDFLVPARICRDRFVVALSTQGASPALAKRLRTELENRLDKGFVPLAELLARLRPMVLALGMEPDQNGAIFRDVAFSELPEAFCRGDVARCKAVLRALLPPAIHSRLTELLYGLV